MYGSIGAGVALLVWMYLMAVAALIPLSATQLERQRKRLGGTGFCRVSSPSAGLEKAGALPLLGFCRDFAAEPVPDRPRKAMACPTEAARYNRSCENRRRFFILAVPLV